MPIQDTKQELHKRAERYDALLFRNVNLSPEQQYALSKSNGTVNNHEGIERFETAVLKHPSHTTFHKNPISSADEAAGITRFFRWYMDAAFYDLSPPRVTTLYGIQVPKQICRYDDGRGNTLLVPLGTTAFVSGKTMFDILPRELQSVAVRARTPHPFEWMKPAAAHSTGLTIESEGKEVPLNELPPWTEDNIKVLPVTWKNSVTGALHFQVNVCAAQELLIDPLPEGASREGVLYSDGAHIKDLKEVRDLLYKMQHPAIAPSPDQVRAFHQCNLAASDDPVGHTPEDVRLYA
ncbi:Clavaminate synthase-like protein [Russula emetica]|nr:Clavaminate synthase-like protein [Russula emetica]